MEQIGAPELILILVIVILLFGPGRIGKAAGELGSGIRAFREGLKGNENSNMEDRNPATVAEEEEVEVEVISNKGRHSHAN